MSYHRYQIELEYKVDKLMMTFLKLKYCESNYTTVIKNNKESIRKKKICIKENTESCNNMDNIFLNIDEATTISIENNIDNV